MDQLDLKPGRLSITCIDAKNIRGRADNSNDHVRPYLLFRLNGTERTSRTGNQLGHNVIFSNEVVAFDLHSPKDVNLVVEVCDDTSIESIGRATFSVADVLTSGTESVETLEIIREGDSSTNSVVNLRFSFVRARVGVIKLSFGGVKNVGRNNYALVSTPDGQSRRFALEEPDDSLGFWLNPTNWFGDFTIQIYDGEGCVGAGKLSLLSCLNGNEIKNATSYVSIAGEERSSVIATTNHWFLEAGVVRVRSMGASGLRNVSMDSRGLSNPRLLVMTSGKTHFTKMMTNAAENAESDRYRWNDEFCLPIVDEYTLQIASCEFDEVSGNEEQIGSAEVSLLPLFKNGLAEITVNLSHETELGETLESGKVHFTMSFEPPRGAAFPRDQPTMTSYILGQSDTVRKVKNLPVDDEDCNFTEEAIKNAFTIFDLDKNGYIGVSELKHILIMMGEHVSDEEVDTMISMLDLNGDGQVSFKEFKAMAQSPDPANEDFLTGGLPERNDESAAVQHMNNQAEKKREAFSRCVRTCKMDKEDIYEMWRVVNQQVRDSPAKNVSHEMFRIDYRGLCDLMPAAFCSAAECRMIFDLLHEEKASIDSRDLIMSFTNFVTGFELEERCRLAFEMFDVDHSGYLSLDEIEAMMMSTNLITHDLIKKRAENFMVCADTDRSGGITIDELVVAAEKLPNLIFPSQTKKQMGIAT